MKILIIMPWIRQGGAELIAARTGLELQKRGHKVKIAALFTDLSKMADWAGELTYVRPGRFWQTVFKKSKWALYFLGPFWLWGLVWREAEWAEVLFPHSLPAYWVAPIVGRLKKKKTIWLCNEPPRARKELGGADGLMWRLSDGPWEKWLGRLADKVIVYSDLVQKEVGQRYGREAKRVRLGVDFDFFSRKVSEKEKRGLRERFGLGDEPVWLMVGRLDRQKNQRLAVGVFASWQKKKEEGRLVLVGEGPDRQELEKMIDEQGLRRKVILAGLARPEEVRAWYAVADLVLFPSVNQTATMNQSWGFVPFEALCQKKLTIVSTGSGAAEVLVPERIGLAAMPTVAAFGEKIGEFYREKEEYSEWAKRGQVWVKENLTWEKFADEVEVVLKEVAG